MKSVFNIGRFSCLLALLAFFACDRASANAFSYYFIGTAINPVTLSSSPINVEVVVTTLQDAIQVDVYNRQTNLVSDLGTIGGIDFGLNIVPTGTNSITSRTGINRTISTSGFTDGAAFTTGWGVLASPVYANGFDLTTFTGGAPTRTIAGPGPYPGANNSLTGNHNPFLVGANNGAGPVSFTITFVPGSVNPIHVTPQTLLSQIGIYFGTDRSTFVTLIPVPEPTSAALLGLGLAVLGAVRRRRS